MTRTTIFVEDDLLLEVRRVAQTSGVTITDVINRALKAYVGTLPQRGLPSFAAVARDKRSRSGGRTAKHVVRQAVDPYEGSAREGRR